MAEPPAGAAGIVDLERLDKLQALVGTAEFRRLAEGFLADLARRLEAMAGLAASGDHAALASEAHRLKGTAGSYGLQAVTAQSEGLETACAGGDRAAIAAALEGLDGDMRASMAQLQQRFDLTPAG